MPVRLQTIAAFRGRNFVNAGLGVALMMSVAACATQQQMVASKEDSFAAAGFVARPANTPERQAMLSRLPANRFVQRSRGDTISYVYADPVVCQCIYVGSQQAYGRYRDALQQQHIATEQELSAQMYSDSAWNWGGWGPWGTDFAYGPGYGW